MTKKPTNKRLPKMPWSDFAKLSEQSSKAAAKLRLAMAKKAIKDMK
jgi:hypothetical protein